MSLVSLLDPVSGFIVLTENAVVMVAMISEFGSGLVTMRMVSDEEEQGARFNGRYPECGAIFMSNIATKDECFGRRLFGLPSTKGRFVEKVKTGMILFLFEYERRELHGVFQARSDGELNIFPRAYNSSGKQFPAQVKVTPIWHCHPLTESEFRGAIKENYFSIGKFNFGLSEAQVRRLLTLFSSRRINDQRPKSLSATRKKARPKRKVRTVENLECNASAPAIPTEDSVQEIDVLPNDPDNPALHIPCSPSARVNHGSNSVQHFYDRDGIPSLGNESYPLYREAERVIRSLDDMSKFDVCVPYAAPDHFEHSCDGNILPLPTEEYSEEMDLESSGKHSCGGPIWKPSLAPGILSEIGSDRRVVLNPSSSSLSPSSYPSFVFDCDNPVALQDKLEHEIAQTVENEPFTVNVISSGEPQCQLQGHVHPSDRGSANHNEHRFSEGLLSDSLNNKSVFSRLSKPSAWNSDTHVQKNSAHVIFDEKDNDTSVDEDMAMLNESRYPWMKSKTSKRRRLHNDVEKLNEKQTTVDSELDGNCLETIPTNPTPSEDEDDQMKIEIPFVDFKRRSELRKVNGDTKARGNDEIAGSDRVLGGQHKRRKLSRPNFSNDVPCDDKNIYRNASLILQVSPQVSCGSADSVGKRRKRFRPNYEENRSCNDKSINRNTSMILQISSQQCSVCEGSSGSCEDSTGSQGKLLLQGTELSHLQRVAAEVAIGVHTGTGDNHHGSSSTQSEASLDTVGCFDMQEPSQELRSSKLSEASFGTVSCLDKLKPSQELCDLNVGFSERLFLLSAGFRNYETDTSKHMGDMKNVPPSIRGIRKGELKTANNSSDIDTSKHMGDMKGVSPSSRGIRKGELKTANNNYDTDTSKHMGDMKDVSPSSRGIRKSELQTANNSSDIDTSKHVANRKDHPIRSSNVCKSIGTSANVEGRKDVLPRSGRIRKSELKTVVRKPELKSPNCAEIETCKHVGYRKNALPISSSSVCKSAAIGTSENVTDRKDDVLQNHGGIGNRELNTAYEQNTTHEFELGDGSDDGGASNDMKSLNRCLWSVLTSGLQQLKKAHQQ